MNQFLYIPSFDTAVAKNAGKKNFLLKDGTPWRFWSDAYPEKYRWKAYLTTAGHNYRKTEYTKQFDFPEDMLIFGDSGGYQICSGILEWHTDLRKTMFEWLEGNSTVAMNLDVPPRMKWSGKFQLSLEISKENFKYFADRQTGKTEFLNIIQGSDYTKYSTWYKQVKDLPFSGWSIGGAGGSVMSVLAGLTVLLENGEIDDESNKWLHILGASGIVDFLVFAKIQQCINRRNSKLTVTTDSSTPSRSTAYGYFYSGFDMKRAVFRYFQAPKKGSEIHADLASFPRITEIDDRIWDTYTIDEFIQWKQDHYAWLVSRNFAVFLDCYRICIEVVNTDPFITQQMIPSGVFNVLQSIDELFNSANPYATLMKYKDLYIDCSRIDFTSPDISTDFF